MSARSDAGAAAWIGPGECRLADFRSVVEHTTDLADYPFAETVDQNVLVYGNGVDEPSRTRGGRRALRAELARALRDGPGVVAFKRAFDADVVDRATVEFQRMIAEQRASGAGAGDHFAQPGANDRVWGALDKLAMSAPEVFVDYYGNDRLALICEAWLGPGYQVTSQVNVVNPGGQAQVAHTDYHLGFMSADQAASYPAHVHRLSAALTLQGAVAHCDMPVDTGPTMYLPYSQRFGAGYLACRQPDFVDYFGRHHVQLALDKGDAVFFSPALFHGAGTNRNAHVRRMANLLQISSAFGRAMESVDRVAIAAALYPVLADRKATTGTDALLRNVVAASAEGYAFPTNLDRDQPVDGLAPESQAALVRRALEETWDLRMFTSELESQAERRRTEPPR
jgi:ectoine hydroxylase-related dioxygenase (phytanoyl-CoA dioxygenase family)